MISNSQIRERTMIILSILFEFMEIKVIVLGGQSNGKTSILRKIKEDLFSETATTATVGLDYFSEALEIDGIEILLHLWDTASQERYRSINKKYFLGSQIALLVLDSRKPLQVNLAELERDLKCYYEVGDAQHICVLFNKIDLVDSQAYIQEVRIMGEAICNLQKLYNIRGIEFVSAKETSRDKLKAILETIARGYLRKELKESHVESFHNVNTEPSVFLQRSPQRRIKEKNKTKCCNS